MCRFFPAGCFLESLPVLLLHPGPQSTEPQGYHRAFPRPKRGSLTENLLSSYYEIVMVLLTHHTNDLNSLNYCTI